MKARYCVALMVATLVLSLPLTARAEIKAGSVELGLFVGYNFFEDRQNLKDRPVIGGRLGYNFTQHIGIEGAAEFIDTEVDDDSIYGAEEGQFRSDMDTVKLTFYHVDAVYHFKPSSDLNPFILAGFGGAHYNPKISDKDMSAFNIGVGVKYWPSDNFALRVDLRDYMVSEVFNKNYHNVAATVGITIAFGGREKYVPPQPEKPKAQPAPKPEEVVVVLVAEPEAEEVVYVLVAEPKIEEKVIILALEDIHFDYDKSTLNQEAKAILKRNIQRLKKNPKVHFRIAGYTSVSGTKQYNQKLSERRAEGVRDYLIKEGVVTPDRLTTIGFGETRPKMHEAAPKDLYSKAAKANMRVLFEIVVK